MAQSILAEQAQLIDGKIDSTDPRGHGVGQGIGDLRRLGRRAGERHVEAEILKNEGIAELLQLLLLARAQPFGAPLQPLLVGQGAAEGIEAGHDRPFESGQRRRRRRGRDRHEALRGAALLRAVTAMGPSRKGFCPRQKCTSAVWSSSSSAPDSVKGAFSVAWNP